MTAHAGFAAGLGRTIRNPVAITAAVAAFLAGGASLAPALAAGPPGTFDGVYVGGAPNGVNKNPHYNCVAVPGWRITVQGGTASTSWNGPLSGPVGPDGSLSISAPSGTVLKGTFAGGSFSGSVDTKSCGYTLSAKKS